MPLKTRAGVEAHQWNQVHADGCADRGSPDPHRKTVALHNALEALSFGLPTTLTYSLQRTRRPLYGVTRLKFLFKCVEFHSLRCGATPARLKCLAWPSKCASRNARRNQAERLRSRPARGYVLASRRKDQLPTLCMGDSSQRHCRCWSCLLFSL